MNRDTVIGIEAGVVSVWSPLGHHFGVDAGGEGSTELACWRMDRDVSVANANLYFVYLSECDRNPRPHI